MSEMLANHYFMIRNFEEAIKTYEDVVPSKGNSKSIRKKMIICYVRTFQIDKALTEFIKLVKDDVEFILNTKLQADDCPCPEIISEIVNDEIHFKNEEKEIALGILWLYCDINSSLKHFSSYLNDNPHNLELHEAFTIINNYNKNNNL